MEAIPGGGAEIFDEALRAKICPDKCSSEEWLAVHRAAHNMDIPTNCTMLYGHIETIEQRVDHLDRLRRLQDEAPGFDAFIPLKYRSRNNRMSEIGECSVEEDMRMIAMSRIFLDNIPHIKAYWVAYGKPTTEMALAFGADDIDGTIDDSTKIYSMAGADEKPSMSVAELEDLVRGAGFVPIERDTHYNAVVREKRVVAAPKPKTEPQPVVVVAPEPKPEPKPEVKFEPKPEPKVEQKPEVKVEQPTKETKEKEKKSMAKTKAKAKEGVKSFYERHHIISHIILICLVGIALIIALYIGLKIGTRHGNTIAVPNYLGMSVDDVRAHAKREGLEIVVRDSVFDSDVAGGVVVDQLPKLSTKRTVTVKPGRKIYVTINAYNRRMVDVPYVAKQTLRQALNQLERAGLTIEKLNYEPNLTSTDYVVRQSIEGREISPSTATKVPFATGVTLSVTYRRDEQYTVVPRLVGMRLSQAKSTVWDRGLNIKEVVYDATVTDFKQRREAKVYKQSLHQSAGAQRGSEITLYMSCDKHLVDSLTKISDRDARAYEKKRREEEAQREAELAAEEEAAKGEE